MAEEAVLSSLLSQVSKQILEKEKKLRYRGYSAPLPRLSTQRNEEDKKELREEIGETNRRIDDTNKRIVRHIRSLFQQRKIDEINKRADRIREILLTKIDETDKRINSAQATLLAKIKETTIQVDDLYWVIY